MSSHVRVFAFVSVFMAALACGGETPVVPTCVPGQSIACVGTGGCSGGQVCKSDGTYDSCNCSQPFNDGGTQPDGAADGSLPIDAGPDAIGKDGGPWSPKDFAGLALWLDASVGVVADPQKVGFVKRWLDQSGNGNNAEKMDFNGTGIALDPSAIKGHDALTCGYQTNLQVADAPSLQFGTGGFLIAAVLKYGPNANSYPYSLLAKSPTLEFWFPALNAYNFNFTVGAKSLTTSFTTPKFTTLIAQPTMALDFDGTTSTGPAATDDVSSVGASFSICGSSGSTAPMAEFAEIIMVKGAASPGDVAALKAYFKSKYGL